MNLSRRESLTEADFTSRPSSELFTLAVELSKACLSKLREIDHKNNKLQKDIVSKTDRHREVQKSTVSLNNLVAVTRKRREELENEHADMKDRCEFMKLHLVEFERLIERDLMLLKEDQIASFRQRFAHKMETMIAKMDWKDRKEGIKIRSCIGLFYQQRMKNIFGELVREV